MAKLPIVEEVEKRTPQELALEQLKRREAPKKAISKEQFDANMFAGLTKAASALDPASALGLPASTDEEISAKAEELTGETPKTDIIKKVVEGTDKIMSNPNVKEAAKKVVKNNKKDLENLTGKKLNKSTQEKVLSALDKPETLQRIAGNRAEGKTQKGVENQWLEALAYFTPELIGGALGAAFGGVEGAAAGMAGAGQVKAGMEAKEAAKAESEMKKQQIAAQTEQQSADRDARLAIADAQLSSKEKIEANKLRQSGLSTLAERYAKANKTARQKLDSLKGEDKKVISFTMTADRSINDMVKALESGSNTFEIIGTDLYTDARDRFINAMLRRESGAAISDEEYERYSKFVPGPSDSREQMIEKLKRNRDQIDSTFYVYEGLTRKDLNLPTPIALRSLEENKARRDELLAKRGK